MGRNKATIGVEQLASGNNSSKDVWEKLHFKSVGFKVLKHQVGAEVN